MGQFWPVPGPRTALIAYSRGVAPSGWAGPSVALDRSVVTIVGRIDNGNGLTLSTAFQVVGSVPDWAKPAGTVLAPGVISLSAPGMVMVTTSGELQVATSLTAIAFAFSYLK